MKLTRILAVLTVALAASSSAHAVLLSDLLAGGSITAGDKLFDNWSQIAYTATDGRNFNASNIEVSALSGGLVPGPGLKFTFSNNELKMTGDDIYAFVDLSFGFRASVLDPSMMINGSTLQFSSGGALLTWMDDGSYDNGTYILGKVSDTSLANLGDMEAEFSVNDSSGTTNTSGSTSFAPQNEVWITNNILVWATDSSDSAALWEFEQRFSQTTITIPEPTTIYLMGLSFLCLGFSRLRRS